MFWRKKTWISAWLYSDCPYNSVQKNTSKSPAWIHPKMATAKYVCRIESFVENLKNMHRNK